MKNEWYKFVGMMVAGLVLLGGLFTAMPWASKEDMADIKLHIQSIEALKQQDNKWYRELDTELKQRMARMEANVENIKEDIREIKQIVRGN